MENLTRMKRKIVDDYDVCDTTKQYRTDFLMDVESGEVDHCFYELYTIDPFGNEIIIRKTEVSDKYICLDRSAIYTDALKYIFDRSFTCPEIRFRMHYRHWTQNDYRITYLQEGKQIPSW